jgi:HSP20 family protein
MNITDLIPWRSKSRLPVRREDDEIRSFTPAGIRPAPMPFDRMFEEFFGRSTLFPFSDVWDETWRGFTPSLDVTETDAEIRVTAEIPGINEDEIDISMSNNRLSIKGEKRAEHEEKGRNYHRVERSYGSFNRTVPLPPGVVDADKVKATYKNGVLTITLPKLPEVQQSVKRITVN